MGRRTRTERMTDGTWGLCVKAAKAWHDPKYGQPKRTAARQGTQLPTNRRARSGREGTGICGQTVLTTPARHPTGKANKCVDLVAILCMFDTYKHTAYLSHRQQKRDDKTGHRWSYLKTVVGLAGAHRLFGLEAGQHVREPLVLAVRHVVAGAPAETTTTTPQQERTEPYRCLSQEGARGGGGEGGLGIVNTARGSRGRAQALEAWTGFFRA